ncbi:MAG: response regulator [Planctomycetes bacterium]|nr:response regulator [Planctomycetota bacterium]
MNDAPLPPDLVSHVRHDLRTFVNHILGFSEMILEAVQDDGVEALAPGLEEIHGLGKALLDAIGRHLAPGRTDVTLIDCQALADQIGGLSQTLLDRTKAILEQTQQLGREQDAADLHKILGAIHQLRAFAGSRLVGHDSDRVVEPPRSESYATKPDSDRVVEPVGEPARSESYATKPDSTSPTAGSGRILVVDDVENNRTMLQRRLEGEGYTVSQAANGREGLDRIGQGGLDLVLLDILMPEVDGFEVLRQVKATASGRDLPIIMISSLDEIESVVRCIEMGAEDYLPKPFDPVLLRARVGACLEKKRLRDQELDYLRQVTAVTTAAGAVEAGKFDASSLQEVAQRGDELGRLARVFQRMGQEVQAREERLQMQVQQLKIEIDESRKKQSVAEVTESEYFLAIERAARKAQEAKERRRRAAPPMSDAP